MPSAHMALPLRSNDDGSGSAGEASRFPLHAHSFDQIPFPLNLLCGFAPFLAYAVLSRLSISLGLWIAFAIAFALGLPVFLHTRTIRTLDGGGVMLFGIAAILAGVLRALSDFSTARFVVMVGMLATVLASFVLRQPFALQYAHPDDADFVRCATRISLGWVAAFAVMTAADCVALYARTTPEWAVFLTNLVALAAAITLTLRFAAGLHRTRTP